MNDIDEVKSRINIVDIIGEKVRLKKAGANYFGLCPFHNEKTPSFSVNENLQIFKCFGCGESGDAIKFMMKVNNMTFPEVLEELSERTGYKLQGKFNKAEDKELIKKRNIALEINEIASNFFLKELIANEENPGYRYLRKRNLTVELAKVFKLGYASESYQNLIQYFTQKGYTEKNLLENGLITNKNGRFTNKFRNRLIFSVFDTKGNIVGFSGRYIGEDKGDFTPPKYLNSPETVVFNKSKLIFGLYQASESIRKMKFVILCEGQMNVLSSYRVGVKNIVASLGTSFTPSHLEILRRQTSSIYLSFDKDSAGKKATLRVLEMIFSSESEINVKVVAWDKSLGKDPDEVILKDEKKWFDAVNNAMDPIDYLINEFYCKTPNPTVENKNAFLKILIPLIKKHRNAVLRDEYLKSISKKLNINLDSMEKSYGQDISKKEIIQAKPKIISNLPNIYDYIFGIILQNWDIAKNLIFSIDRDLIIDKYLELYDCITVFIDSENVNEIFENLDEANQEIFQDILMQKIQIDRNTSYEEHILKNIPLLMRLKYREISEKLKLEPDNNELVYLLNKLASKISGKTI